MMRSLLAGVSGLRAHQQKMDVIGNNIANVNTVGYKASRVTFSDIFSQTLSGATGADSTTGRAGKNATQIGLGVGVSSIDTVTTAGSTESTGNQTDLSISGNGFFIVREGNSSTYKFTRAGDFTLDDQGNLVTSGGLNVCGWMDYGGTQNSDGSYTFDTDKQVEAINLYSDKYNNNKKTIAAEATENASFSGTLDSSEDVVTDITSTDPQYTTTMTVYDALGNSYEVEVNFWKTGSDNTTNDVDGDGTADLTTTWTWQIADTSDVTLGTTASGTLVFDSSGNLYSGDTSSVTFTPASGGADSFNTAFDFSGVSMTSGDSSVQTSSVDGCTAGTLEDFSIGEDGIILGTYSNGKTRPLGMIALATFSNPSGLEKAGDNTYIATANSGDFVNGVTVGSEGSGSLSAGTLEMSNVDLSYEFSQMIITQRGFQANSRIITTSDEMLEELVNLKR